MIIAIYFFIQSRKKPLEYCYFKILILLLYTIWQEMTEDSKRLLILFEVRFHELLSLCDEQRLKIQELEKALEMKNTELEKAFDDIKELNAKCDNMLTAHVLSVHEGEVNNAKLRLSKLVREVDKCIALLNE